MTQTAHQSLADLNHIHRQLDELFQQHQLAVLHEDFPLAVKLLAQFEKGLFWHMREEEEILMPLYREGAANILGGDPDIFLGEHKKISEWINRLKVRLQRLSTSPDSKAVLALLDDEAPFKKYMEHHALREDRVFYPELDRVVGEKNKPPLLRLLTFSLEEMTETA